MEVRRCNGRRGRRPGIGSNPPAAYAFEAQEARHVIYISSPDNPVHELWWDTNGVHNVDLTATTGAVPALQI